MQDLGSASRDAIRSLQDGLVTERRELRGFRQRLRAHPAGEAFCPPEHTQYSAWPWSAWFASGESLLSSGSVDPRQKLIDHADQLNLLLKNGAA